MAASLVSAALAGLVLLGGLPGSQAKYLIDTRDNTVASARGLASDLMAFYKGNQSGEIPGILSLPPPSGDYYWWSSAGFWSAFIDYWRLTGDTTYNDLVTQGLQFQAGTPPFYAFMSPNWTASMGNDDQCVWGLAAMRAAETGFQNPPSGQPQWLSLAQGVFDSMAMRIQNETECGGGLRWQIPFFNVGYDYKNSASPKTRVSSVGSVL